MSLVLAAIQRFPGMARIIAWLSSGRRMGTTTRIAFAMAMWTATVLLCLRVLGYLDDGLEREIEHRTRLCETVAIACSQIISSNAGASPQVLLETLKHRNPEILSVGFRLSNGQVTNSVGDHEAYWCQAKGQSVNGILVPVLRGNDQYAQIEAAFEPYIQSGVLGFFAMPSIRVTLIATLANLLGFLWWLRHCFQHLDPSRVIPDRVRSALDTFAEMILVVDDKNRVMMVNGRLSDLLGGQPDQYQGKQLESLSWHKDSLAILNSPGQGDEDDSSKVILLNAKGERHYFKMNQSAIIDDEGNKRGRLLSLDDITVIEKQQEQLQQTLTDLQRSQAEIAEQNEKLQYLATRDPMTGCFNRRSFFESFEKTWTGSIRYDHPLSCVMVDVDHFKSINDNFGHAMGDEVLKSVAETLLNTAREADIVCRYGGEEFCVLLPNVDAAGARQAGERFRQAIADLHFEQLSVTASLGCADRTQGAQTAEGMLEQADQALYKAKRGGRNQVVAFSTASEGEISATDQDVQEQVVKELASARMNTEEQGAAPASSAGEIAPVSTSQSSISPPLPAIPAQASEIPRADV